MQIVEPRCANYSGHKWRAVCSAGYPILSDVDTILTALDPPSELRDMSLAC